MCELFCLLSLFSASVLTFLAALVYLPFIPFPSLDLILNILYFLVFGFVFISVFYFWKE